jgi:hypothetical protein
MHGLGRHGGYMVDQRGTPDFDGVRPGSRNLSESLASYAMHRMKERGVTFRLNTRVTDARPGSVTLGSGEEISAPKWNKYRQKVVVNYGVIE